MPESEKPYQSYPYRQYPEHTDTPTDDIFCRKCGTIGEYRETPGSGPHHASLSCTACGAFIRWAPKPKPPARPTEKQIWYLRLLGYEDAIPETRQQASQRIADLVKTRGSRYV